MPWMPCNYEFKRWHFLSYSSLSRLLRFLILSRLPSHLHAHFVKNDKKIQKKLCSSSACLQSRKTHVDTHTILFLRYLMCWSIEGKLAKLFAKQPNPLTYVKIPTFIVYILRLYEMQISKENISVVCEFLDWLFCLGVVERGMRSIF